MTLSDVKMQYQVTKAYAEVIEQLLEKEHYVAARDVLPVVRVSRQAFEEALAAYEAALHPPAPPAPAEAKTE